MNYYYLKITQGNADARDWLEGKMAGYPAAVIYFDNLTLAQYGDDEGGKEPREFLDRSKQTNRADTRMVVIHDGEVWILEPAGDVRFRPSEAGPAGQHTPKVMPVKILAHKNAKDVPLVLASITANQFYTRGTFRRINDWGNFKAIDRVAGGPLKGEHWQVAKQGPEQLLECLSSIELETLVAKLLEAKGCFVPAYRGGLMKDIDLIARNCSRVPINFAFLTLQPNKSVSFQIKRWTDSMPKPSSVDCLVGFGVKGPGVIDAKKLLSLVYECPDVNTWFHLSLSEWLPEEFLAKVGDRLRTQVAS